MPFFRKILSILLIVVVIFLAVSAVISGIALLFGMIPLPLELLEGSLFGSYLVPALSLGLLVGGSATLAAVLLLRKSRFGVLAAAAAAVMIMFFEFVEVLTIGSPAGVARNLQILYFGLGTLMMVISLGLWFLDLRSQ